MSCSAELGAARTMGLGHAVFWVDQIGVVRRKESSVLGGRLVSRLRMPQSELGRGSSAVSGLQRASSALQTLQVPKRVRWALKTLQWQKKATLALVRREARMVLFARSV